ncbi:MAG TPA: helix-turn-helix transcriptional regulator [Paludibacter sp.]|nr:helix-turn-helix transcriptional regulator [Paludibacter sp.]
MSKQSRNTILMIKIANRIKQLRFEKGISQDTFFIDTDIHIARIESGKSNITVNTLSTICDYLGISLTDFFKEI